MKKAISLLLALVLVLGLAACGGKDAPAGGPQSPADAPDAQQPAGPTGSAEPAGPETGHYPVTITNYDYEGNPVEYTYEKAPERVICVYQGCVETMIALGLEDRVLASYGLDNEVKDEWKAGFAKMHYDESVFAPDKETVTLLEPDMIFSWGRIRLEPEGRGHLHQRQQRRGQDPHPGERVQRHPEHREDLRCGG